jgi:hypothetical protein
MIRRPTDQINDIRNSINDIIDQLIASPRFEIRMIDITAISEETMSFEIQSLELTTLMGAIQINSTTSEQPIITFKNTTSVLATYDFAATTNGKQTVTFLLIGV